MHRECELNGIGNGERSNLKIFGVVGSGLHKRVWWVVYLLVVVISFFFFFNLQMCSREYSEKILIFFVIKCLCMKRANIRCLSKVGFSLLKDLIN